uniref:G_PROTEIN_RECEP_F1_2 domain-containing protein n=1 Tax=Steinernema glaseri TaxID=37863 RepID=A0A1I7YVW5_9BILA
MISTTVLLLSRRQPIQRRVVIPIPSGHRTKTSFSTDHNGRVSMPTPQALLGCSCRSTVSSPYKEKDVFFIGFLWAPFKAPSTMWGFWEVAQKAIMWLEVFGYLLAAPLDIYLVCCLLKSGLLHGNLKIILINLSATCIVFACARLAFHFDGFLQHAGFGPDNIACRHVLSIAQLLYDSSCYMISTSMFLVTIERAIATCIPSSYEQQRGTRRVTMIVCLLWTVILGISVFNYFYYKVSVTSCDPSTAPPSISTLYSNSQHLLLLAGIATVGVSLAGIVSPLRASFSPSQFLSVLLFLNVKRRKKCDI